MKLVATTATLEKRFGLYEAIKKLKEYGFDAYDCTLSVSMKSGGEFSCDDWREKAQKIREFSDALGMKCVQTHTPSRTSNIKGLTYFLSCIEEEERAVEISGILGAEIAIVHPTSVTDVEGNYDMLYSKVLPIAKKYGVKIACENMFAWESKPEHVTIPTACGSAREFVRCVDYVNDEDFTACLDIGHSYLPNSEGAYLIKALGHDRLKALHVHDNNLWDDEHVYPFFGKINWDEVCRTLAEIDYSGHFTFETHPCSAKFPSELLPYAFKLLEKTGRYLINKIEQYKKELKK